MEILYLRMQDQAINQFDETNNYVNFILILGYLNVWGGRTEGHAHAQEDAWKKILNFLRTNLVNTEPTASRL